MNKIIINLILLLFISIITLIGLYFWDFINIPINRGLIGFEGLGEKNLHPQNDTLRFIFLILFCLIPYLALYRFFYKRKTLSIYELITQKLKFETNSRISFFFYVIIIFIIIDFISLDFKAYVTNLDIFHEGIWLSPSVNYLSTNKIWESTFLERGLQGNLFPLVLWKFFDIFTIGSSRFTLLLNLFLCKILLVFLAKNISSLINFEKNIKLVFFIILSFFFISLVKYNGTSYFSDRTFLILIFLNLLFLVFSRPKAEYVSLFLGMFSSFSIVLYVDAGIYINVLIFILLLFFLIQKNYIALNFALLGIFLSWFLFFIAYYEEFDFFINNLYILISSIEQIGSLQYPSPLFGADGRATKTLIFFIIAGVLNINILFNKKSYISNNGKFFLIFLFIISLISFKYSLGRSDSYHIKGGSAFLMLLLAFNILYNFFIIILNLFKNYFTRIKIGNYFIYFFFIFLTFINYENSFSNSFNFKKNLIFLVNSPNSSFLKNELNSYNELVDIYKDLSKNEDCIQIFTDEIALNYLVFKKSCTRFHLMVTASSQKNQINFINELNKKKPKIILYKSKKYEFNSMQERLKLVDKYINNNYIFYYEYRSWVFYKTKD